MLNETPWVMDADRETEQKQRLADFFDENLMNARLASAAVQLEKLQLADGSWSWWEGMPGSFYITVEVSEMLVRLQQMTGKEAVMSSALRSQLDKAFGFMDAEILELVAEMKKDEKKGHPQTFPSQKVLQYLYLSTIDGRKPSSAVASAQLYLKNLLKKEARRLSIYDKAMAAIVLNSQLYVKSLKEWTTNKPTWDATTIPRVPATPGATIASPHRWLPSRPSSGLLLMTRRPFKKCSSGLCSRSVHRLGKPPSTASMPSMRS